MHEVRDEVLAAGLADADELDALEAELERLAADPTVLLSLARTIAAWAGRPRRPTRS